MDDLSGALPDFFDHEPSRADRIEVRIKKRGGVKIFFCGGF